ncbi:MAG: hypothetical protein D6813_00070 [Calditrichaeota bacterium]|nr:MAG: hypothetical protein D6813_00070 [Calditrichota bacterium]
MRDIPQLYLEQAGEWLLLEVLETNAKNEPIKFRLLAHNPDKYILHDFILEDDHWDWSKKYLLVFADPNKPCTLE